MLLRKRLFEFGLLFDKCELLDVVHNWKSKSELDVDSGLYVMVSMLMYDDDVQMKFNNIATVSQSSCVLNYCFYFDVW